MLTLNIESTLPEELQKTLTYQQKVFKAKQELEKAAKAQASWHDFVRHASASVDIYTDIKYLSMQQDIIKTYKEKFDNYMLILEEGK